MSSSSLAYLKINIKTRIIHIGVAIFSILTVLPFFLMLATSLKTSEEVYAEQFVLLPSIPQFSNYVKAMSMGHWDTWFTNTIITSTISLVLSLLFNTMAGYSFARLQFKGRDILFFGILLGLMVAPQLTLLPTFIIMKSMPLMGGNDIFGNGGSGLVDTYAGIIIPSLSGAFGVFLCRQYYLNFPRSLDDAALIDGANPWTTFIYIYLPNSKPLLLSLGILKISYTWNDYMWPLVITQSERVMTLQLGLAQFKDEVIEWELLMAATTIVMLPMLILFLLAQKYFVSGMITSGVKG